MLSVRACEWIVQALYVSLFLCVCVCVCCVSGGAQTHLFTESLLEDYGGSVGGGNYIKFEQSLQEQSKSVYMTLDSSLYK